MSVSRDAIIEVIKTIEDPELFLDIWFLGLIYSIEISEESAVAIEMTFTSPMCPAGPSLIEQVKTKVGAIEGVSACEVKITFVPAWEPSDEVKGLLGML
jgi:metal-sulfur cluster biosynthetic enzyme